ncbi:phosphoglycerate dehydrogenase [Enterococcus dongliensis]|uniref:phosphoglycerate dehydrogenase n=1 Tax=Enterococcus dongliensis TaxID=2559925 RepID=UPI00288D582C|nr:phosphoglycerate dehydrogenase [Enterococcus dongliensis]MDT2640826.1 phosphoglycerate dehydrogenase [Enterococcus dongliensis]
MDKILITPRGYAKYGEEFAEILINLGYQVDMNTTGAPYPREIFIKKAQESTAIIVGVDELDGALLRTCEKLKAIVKFGVGTDNIDLSVAEELGINVGRCVGMNANAVAEFTIGLVFASARHIVKNAQDVKSGEWPKPTGCELLNKTIGILGFGNIRKNVARIAHGIGMKVKVYDVFPISDKNLSEFQADQLTFNELIRVSDIITVHVPLLPETKDLISTREFNEMKDTTIVVNCARGGVVNEFDLYNALSKGKIAAAASDVFVNEPPQMSGWMAKLIALPNFISTAHIGSRSEEAEIRTSKSATEQVIELLKK